MRNFLHVRATLKLCIITKDMANWLKPLRRKNLGVSELRILAANASTQCSIPLHHSCPLPVLHTFREALTAVRTRTENYKFQTTGPFDSPCAKRPSSLQSCSHVTHSGSCSSLATQLSGCAGFTHNQFMALPREQIQATEPRK